MNSTSPDDTIRKLFKGGGIIFIGLLIELLISFIGKIIIARFLGPMNYGVVTIGITTTAIISTVSIIGLDTGISRYMPRFGEPSQIRGILISAFQMGLPPALIIGILIAAFSKTFARNLFHDPAVAPVLTVFGLLIPIAALMKLCIGAVRGMQRTIPRVLVQNITFPVVRFLGIIFFISIGAGVTGVTWAFAGSYVAAAALGLYFVIRDTPLFERDLEIQLWRKELLIFSMPILISTTMTTILSDVDIFMVGYFVNPSEVGVYNTIYPIAKLSIVPLSAFGFIFMPLLSELHANKNQASMLQMYQVSSKWIFSMTLPVVAIVGLFPVFVISHTFGGAYTSGSSALTLLTLSFFTHSLVGLNGSSLTATGHTRLVMYDNVFVAIVNVMLNLLLVPQWGFFGAAVATAVAYLVLNLIYGIHLYRTNEIHPFSRQTVILFSTGILYLTVAGVIISQVVVTPIIVVLTGTIICGGYGFVLMRYGIGQEEVMIVNSIEERFQINLEPVKSRVRQFMNSN